MVSFVLQAWASYQRVMLPDYLLFPAGQRYGAPNFQFKREENPGLRRKLKSERREGTLFHQPRRTTAKVCLSLSFCSSLVNRKYCIFSNIRACRSLSSRFRSVVVSVMEVKRHWRGSKILMQHASMYI